LYNVIYRDLNYYHNISFPFIKIPEKSFLIIPEIQKVGQWGSPAVCIRDSSKGNILDKLADFLTNSMYYLHCLQIGGQILTSSILSSILFDSQKRTGQLEKDSQNETLTGLL
jgi:hypothetical protein